MRDAKKAEKTEKGEWVSSDPMTKQNDLFDEYYKVCLDQPEQ